MSLGSSPTEIGLPPGSSHPDRRRRVRHKVHTPAYACLDPSSSRPLNLCEIIDISEEGMAIQTLAPLQVGQDESFSLALSETQASIPAAGKVVWSDPSGRAGIHFPHILDEALRGLQQWLLANADAGRMNGAAQSGAVISQQSSPDHSSPVLTRVEDSSAYADYTSVLSGLAAVKREVESLRADLDAALQLAARRAQAFTRANGAAIALTEGQDMTCRAAAGAATPSVGTHLRIGQGFSGECVRKAKPLRCEDSDLDSRVDRESCLALGIRSLVAVPVFQADTVIGLLEVFSSEPGHFTADDENALTRLAKLISEAVQRAGAPEPGESKLPSSVDDEFPSETPADLPLPQLSRSRNVLLLGAAVTVGFVLVWLVGPWDTRLSAPPTRPSPDRGAAVSQPASPGPTAVSGLEGLRRSAEQGDSAAQFAMGAHYATGEAVSQDYAEAARWFTKAAEQGNVMAQATLGTYYWAGRGVPPDPVRAYFWSLVAQAGGDNASKDRLTIVASRLTHDQMAAVQRQANDWIKQHPPTSRTSTVAP